jgi:hypothetical protein
VWGSGASDVWVAGDSTLLHFDGSAWSNVPMVGELALMRSAVPSVNGLFPVGLWGSGPKDIYLGGDGGRIARFDGASWHVMQTPTTHRVMSISGVAGLGAIAVTESQTTRPGAILLRGAGPTGGFSAAMGAPTAWP